MQTRFGAFLPYSDTVVCPKCGIAGVIKWDEVQTPNGPGKDFAGLSSDFYERLSARAPHPIEIVCRACDAPVKSEVDNARTNMTITDDNGVITPA